MRNFKGEVYQDNLQMVLDAQTTCCAKSRSKTFSKSTGDVDDPQSTVSEKVDKRHTIDGRSKLCLIWWVEGEEVLLMVGGI